MWGRETTVQTVMNKREVLLLASGALLATQLADLRAKLTDLTGNHRASAGLVYRGALVENDRARLADLLFAWKVAKFVKSNAIVYCKDGMTIGVGAGQMSRVYSARIAAIKAEDEALGASGVANRQHPKYSQWSMRWCDGYSPRVRVLRDGHNKAAKKRCSADSEEEGYPAAAAVDGDRKSYWCSAGAEPECATHRPSPWRAGSGACR